MIAIPDLFGAFQKGREAAIEANWKDLQNYESIESARHQNDAAALANLATMADFGKERQLKNNQVTNSDLTTEHNRATQPSKLYKAGSDALVEGVNYATLAANPDILAKGATSNLRTWYNNGLTGENNSSTNVLNSSIIKGVTKELYPDLYNAAFASVKSGADIQTITAQYGPATAKLALDLQLKEGLVTYEKYNQEMERLRAIAPYVGATAAAEAQAGLITAEGTVTQAGTNKKVIEHSNKSFELTNQLVQLTNAYQTEVTTAGPNTKRAMDLAKLISEVQTNLIRLAGGTGSIAAHTPISVPVVDPNTGATLGSVDTSTGAVTRANPTGTPTGTTTGNLSPASPLVRPSPQIAADPLFIGSPHSAIPKIARVVPSTALISPSQLNSNLQNRKGGIL